MRAALSIAFLLVLLFWSPVIMSQTPDELRSDEAINAGRVSSPEVGRLARELSLARKAGDISRAQSLEKALFGELPTLPAEDPAPLRAGDFDMPDQVSAPLWGNDVKVYTGDLYGYGKRQICIDADTLGGVYLAMNVKYRDTLSMIRVYKSTNGGENWTSVSAVYSSGAYPMQAFDMCVTDTADGKWLIGIAAVIKYDKSTNGGGSLYWVSVLSDGSNWRSSLIATSNSTIGFRNPAICTDGGYYTPGATYHFVAAEYINPKNDQSRGLYIVRTTNRGVSWGTPDTTLRGFQEGSPAIAVDYSTVPDSLVVVFSRFATPNRLIRVGRSSKTPPFAWSITYPAQTGDNYDPALAIDATRGNAMITYTRDAGSPNNADARCFRSTDLFKTYAHDSIAATTANEGLTSVSYAPWMSGGYYWRVAYRSSANGGTIYYKALMNTLSGWYTTGATVVNDFQPSGVTAPAIGYDRSVADNRYRGNVAYVGLGPKDVYFDAVDLTLDVSDAGVLPESYSLAQNFPNPFNPSTTIRFGLPQVSSVELTVYNAIGQQVATIVKGERVAGNHEVTFDATGLSSGVYFYRLHARPLSSSGGSGEFLQVRKLLLLR